MMESENNSVTMHQLCTLNVNFKLKDSLIFFQKDLLCSDKYILYCTDTLIYTIDNCPESTKHLFRFKIDYIETPSDRPTSKIVQNSDMLSAYKNSNILEKQTMTLDPLYGSEFSEQPLESKIIHICFPQSTIFSDNIVAVVTNYGQCEIVKLNIRENNWNNTILKVNSLWNNIFLPPIHSKLNELENIRNYIENYTIAHCCWLDNINKINESILFCATISGWIVVIKIIQNEESWLMEQQFQIQTDLYKINCMRSYTYKMKNGTERTILICGDIKGRIKMFNFNEAAKKLIEINSLWNTVDFMSSKSFLINYCSNDDVLIVTTTKSSHFLFFVISASGDNEKIINKHVFCEMQIVGFDNITPYEYIICTINGCTKLLKINNQNTNYTTSLTDIVNDFDTENYLIIGMFATPNKVGWLFLLYPHKMFIQTQNIKNFGFILIYTLSTINPLQIINDIPAENYKKLEYYNDCNEIIRLRIYKNILNENYSNFSIEPIEISDAFLHRLRIKFVLEDGYCGYNVRKLKNSGENFKIECDNIILTIKTISAFCRLQYIKNFKNLSKFQMETMNSLRRVISQYLNADLNENYSHVRNILRTTFENTLESTKNVVDDFKENCIYCKQNIDLSSENCSHDFPRCCISYVQIPDIKMKYCRRCKSTVLNDSTLLREILYENERIMCSFCNIPIN